MNLDTEGGLQDTGDRSFRCGHAEMLQKGWSIAPGRAEGNAWYLPRATVECFSNRSRSKDFPRMIKATQ